MERRVLIGAVVAGALIGCGLAIVVMSKTK
jgi:hypothetical protein